MSPRGRKKQFEQLKEQVMWKKTVENKKAEERSRDVAYLRTFVFNFPIPKIFCLN